MSQEDAMSQKDVGKQLHDRATRGETLSADEEAQLREWYVAQDKAEFLELGLDPPEEEATAPGFSLPKELERLLARLQEATRRVQKISSENEALRRDIAHLRMQLVGGSSARSA